MKKRHRIAGRIAALTGLLCGLFFAGCSLQSEEELKLRDLDFTVLSEEKIPEELKAEIEKTKDVPFQLTYQDKEHLYLCVGYGKQETGGYSIAVDELYLTDSSICVDTSLLGPEAAEKGGGSPSYPYIVLKTELLEQTVEFR